MIEGDHKLMVHVGQDGKKSPKRFATLACHTARDSGIPQLSLSDHDASPMLNESQFQLQPLFQRQ